MLQELIVQKNEEIVIVRKGREDLAAQLHTVKVERANFEMMVHQSEKMLASLKEKVRKNSIRICLPFLGICSRSSMQRPNVQAKADRFSAKEEGRRVYGYVYAIISHVTYLALVIQKQLDIKVAELQQKTAAINKFNAEIQDIKVYSQFLKLYSKFIPVKEIRTRGRSSRSCTKSANRR